jgi:hypothetical protein
MEAYLPPGYGNVSGIDGIDPYGVARRLYLYDLAVSVKTTVGTTSTVATATTTGTITRVHNTRRERRSMYRATLLTLAVVLVTLIVAAPAEAQGYTGWIEHPYPSAGGAQRLRARGPGGRREGQRGKRAA